MKTCLTFKEIALKKLAKNKADTEILELTGLTLSELNELKNRP